MPLCQSHAYFQEERRCENRKTETFVCHQTPLGRLCFFGVPERCSDQAACMTMTPQRCLPYSATVQDQGLRSSLVFDTIFSIFCLTVMGNVWKHALCVFEGLVRGWIPLTDGSVSSDNCCPRLPQMEDAGEKMAAPFERRAFNRSQFLDLNCHMWESREDRFCLTCRRHFDTWRLMFGHFIWVHACCVSVFTCCHPNTSQFVLMWKRTSEDRHSGTVRDGGGQRESH